MIKKLTQLFSTPRKPWLLYSLLALFVMGPMLLPGYILTMDMVFTPNIPAPTYVSNSFLWQWALHILNVVIPSQVIEKLIIFGGMVLAGVGMHRLVESQVFPKKDSGFTASNASVSAYFAGILYVVNPFTYERWLAGHYLLLAGYALLPWLVQSLFAFVNKPARQAAIKLSAWYAAVAVVSIHMLVISLIVGVIIGLTYIVVGDKQKAYRTQLLIYGSLVVGIFSLLNSYWLLGVLRGTSEITRTITTFDNRHLEAFTTTAHQQFGLITNVIGLCGFWLERYRRFVLPNVALWLIVTLIVLCLVTIGVKARWKQDRRQTLSLLFIASVGLFIASGIHAPLWGGINHWLLSHVPIMQGFREPQKFVATLALVYCYFAAAGVHVILHYGRVHKLAWQNFLPAAMFLLPIAWVPTMPLGFAGQLKPVRYPASWYAFNQKLQREPGEYKLLFLPWHQYMSYDFSPRIIATPAPRFFDAHIDALIYGDNAEFGDVIRDTINPTSDYVEQQILGKASVPGMGARLNVIGVKYVLLAHGPDRDAYRFLDTQPQLIKISDDPSLIVYENTEYTASHE